MSVSAGPLDEANAAHAKGDYATALQLLRPLAERGNAEAQYKVAYIYDNAEGVSQNYGEALKWYGKAAEQDYSPAQNNLGLIYFNGHGVAQNYVEALKWYRKAAEQGNVRAQGNIGRMYFNGHGVAQNYVEALKWYRKAAEQGNDFAQGNVGWMYFNGHGVPQDYVEALKWYCKAAEQGNAWAQNNLGWMYETGTGVPQDYVSAHFWFNVAATYAEEAGTRTSAAEGRQNVAALMTGQQIARAQELAARWQSKNEAPASTTPPLQPPQPENISDVAPVSTGTGFYVSQGGHTLTNAHVVERCGKIRLRDSDGTVRDASVTGRDAQNDLALLKSVSAAPAFASFTTRRLRLGQPIVVYGFPLSGLLTSAGNLTTGSVSGLAGPSEDARLMQISAPIQPGNSGSPVFDVSGNVVGVAVSKLDAIALAKATEDIAQNVNFAIKGSLAQIFLESRGVDFIKSSDENALSPEAIAARAMRFTVRVECVR